MLKDKDGEIYGVYRKHGENREMARWRAVGGREMGRVNNQKWVKKMFLLWQVELKTTKWKLGGFLYCNYCSSCMKYDTSRIITQCKRQHLLVTDPHTNVVLCRAGTGELDLHVTVPR